MAHRETNDMGSTFYQRHSKMDSIHFSPLQCTTHQNGKKKMLEILANLLKIINQKENM